MTQQMDLLDELDLDHTVLDATVLGWFLMPVALAMVVAALDDEQTRADFERQFGSHVNGRHHGPRSVSVRPNGIRVNEWPRHQPWLITWDRMWAAVAANLTPHTGAALLAAVAARDSHEVDRPTAYRMASYRERSRDLTCEIRTAARAILGDSGGAW